MPTCLLPQPRTKWQHSCSTCWLHDQRITHNVWFGHMNSTTTCWSCKFSADGHEHSLVTFCLVHLPTTQYLHFCRWVSHALPEACYAQQDVLVGLTDWVDQTTMPAAQLLHHNLMDAELVSTMVQLHGCLFIDVFRWHDHGGISTAPGVNARVLMPFIGFKLGMFLSWCH